MSLLLFGHSDFSISTDTDTDKFWSTISGDSVDILDLLKMIVIGIPYCRAWKKQTLVNIVKKVITMIFIIQKIVTHQLPWYLIEHTNFMLFLIFTVKILNGFDRRKVCVFSYNELFFFSLSVFFLYQNIHELHWRFKYIQKYYCCKLTSSIMLFSHQMKNRCVQWKFIDMNRWYLDIVMMFRFSLNAIKQCTNFFSPVQRRYEPELLNTKKKKKSLRFFDC